MAVKTPSIERLENMARGDVYLLSVSQFPMRQSELIDARQLISSLITEYRASNSQLGLEIIVRQNCLYTGLLDTFVENAPQWMPQQGLAVIPHKPPPHMPTKDEIEGVDPRLLDQYGVTGVVDVPEFLFQIMNEAGKDDCWQTLLGHGALSFILTTLKGQSLKQKWKEVFGGRVVDRHFRGMPLFIPLFGVESFQGATEDELSTWFESFELYIGESKDDQGIVIASRRVIRDLVEALVKDLPKPEAEPVTEILRW